MQKPAFEFDYVGDWRLLPMARAVHRLVDSEADIWDPPAPQRLQHLGYPVLRVEVGRSILAFSSPAQLAHCADVLSRQRMPTSLQLSAPAHVPGPNKHWLSRLPAEVKSPRNRFRIAAALQAFHREFVSEDGISFCVDGRNGGARTKPRSSGSYVKENRSLQAARVHAARGAAQRLEARRLQAEQLAEERRAARRAPVNRH